MAYLFDDGTNAYRTNDGKVFTTEKEAQEHANSLGSGQTWHYSDEVEKIFNAGYDCFTSGYNDAAIAKFNEYIAHQEHSRYNNPSYRYRAACYLNKGNNDQAIADATSAINIYDVDPLAYLVRGIAYKNKGNREQAIADLKKAADYGTGSVAQHGNKALQILSGMGIQYTRQNLYRSSSSSSSSSTNNNGSILFCIIGAIVVAIIGFSILGWLGLIGGAVGGFFAGKWLSGKLIGKILLIALLVLVGGTFIISKLPSIPKTETAVTATVNANVNFRAEPSTGDNIIRQLQQGDTVTLTGKTSGSWTQIKHGSDTGWISTEYLNNSPYAKPYFQPQVALKVRQNDPFYATLGRIFNHCMTSCVT